MKKLKKFRTKQQTEAKNVLQSKKKIITTRHVVVKFLKAAMHKRTDISQKIGKLCQIKKNPKIYMLLYWSKVQQNNVDQGTTYGVFWNKVKLYFTVTLGKNQPLKHEKPKWKSDVPLTDGLLHSKRDEFWDTAPAFEGRKEIWDALKAAAYAAETNDYALAQAIIDGANISLPTGTLVDCYDELGNRYQLPVYCLSAPVNLVEEGSEAESPAAESEPWNGGGEEIIVKFRLSTSGKDLKVLVKTGETVLSAKRRLNAAEGIDPSRQRWYFGGRLLHDKMKIEEAKLQTGFVVQVIVTLLDSPLSD